LTGHTNNTESEKMQTLDKKQNKKSDLDDNINEEIDKLLNHYIKEINNSIHSYKQLK